MHSEVWRSLLEEVTKEEEGTELGGMNLGLSEAGCFWWREPHKQRSGRGILDQVVILESRCNRLEEQCYGVLPSQKQSGELHYPQTSRLHTHLWSHVPLDARGNGIHVRRCHCQAGWCPGGWNLLNETIRGGTSAAELRWITLYNTCIYRFSVLKVVFYLLSYSVLLAA